MNAGITWAGKIGCVAAIGLIARRNWRALVWLAVGVGFTLPAYATNAVSWGTLAVSSHDYEGVYDAGFAGATLTNTGDTAWDGTYFLEMVDDLGNRLGYTQVPATPRGGTVTVSIPYLPRVQGPRSFGFTMLQYDQFAAQNNYFGGTQWRSSLITARDGTWVQSDATMIWTDPGIPPIAASGSEFSVRATIKNVSATTWNSSGFYFVTTPGSTNQIAPVITPSSIPPGGTATLQFDINMPTSGASVIVNLQASVPGASAFASLPVVLTPKRTVWLSSYTFGTAAPATINTDWGLAPNYRLRAKFPINGYGPGWHAATSPNNNGKALDSVPPVNLYYPVSLYYLRYDNYDGSTILEISKDTLQTVAIVPVTAALSSYWFNVSERPTILANMPLPPNYKLTAAIVNANNPSVAISWNNGSSFIDQVPVTGQGLNNYQVVMAVDRYSSDGSTLIEHGPQVVQAVTVDNAPTTNILDSGGTITSTDNYDDEGDYTGTDYSSDYYSFSVSVKGTLHVYSTGSNTDLTAFLYLADGTYVELLGNGGGLEYTAQHVPAGPAQLWVGGNSAGDYQIFTEIGPDQPPPTITTTTLATGAMGVAFPACTVTANRSVTALYAGGLPLGLACNPTTGVISGTPKQMGTFDVYLFAQDGGFIGPSTKLTLTVGKATPTLTLADHSFNGVTTLTAGGTVPNLNATVNTPVANLPTPTGTVTYAVTAGGSGNAEGQSLAYGTQVTVTASYPGDANYLPTSSSANYAVVPAVPPTVQASLVQSGSFTANWSAVTGAAGYRVDVATNSAFSSYVSGYQNLDAGNVTAQPITGLTPGVTYYLRVRAYDGGGAGANTSIVSVTTLPATVSGASASGWADVPVSSTPGGGQTVLTYDGILDEIMPAGTSCFGVYIDSYHETFDTDVGEPTGYIDYGDLNAYWEPWSLTFTSDVPNPTPLPDTFAWYPTIVFDPTITLWASVTAEVVVPDDGYNYGIYADFSGSHLTNPANWNRLDHLDGLNSDLPLAKGTHYIGLGDWNPAVLQHSSIFLVRYGISPGGCTLPFPGVGPVSVSTIPGTIGSTASGTIVLPGNITIKASTDGTATVTIPPDAIPGVTLPGAITVSRSANGTITPTVQLPGGVVLASSGGNATITLPNGTMIKIGSGGGSITLPSGAGIGINNGGTKMQIGMTVPAGASALIGAILDGLGKVFGQNGDQTAQQGRVDCGAWGDLNNLPDLGTLSQGNHTVLVGTTADRRVPPTPEDTVTISLTVLPLVAQMITPAGDPVNNPSDAGTLPPALILDGANLFTYSSDTTGVLSLKLKARVTGIGGASASVKAAFQFTVDSVGSSTMAWAAGNPNGTPTFNGDFMEAYVTFTGLPVNNSDFGLKKVRLYYQGDKVAEQSYEVFYPKNATNHPGGQAGSPNWFYYWTAALGYTNLVYGDVSSLPFPVFGKTPGMVDWTYNVPVDKTLVYTYDGAATVNGPAGPKRTTGIDCFVDTVRHEKTHVAQIASADAVVGLVPNSPWRYGWSWNQGDLHNHWALGPDGVPGVPGRDDDGDGIVDNLIVTGPGELGKTDPSISDPAKRGDDVPLFNPGDTVYKNWPLAFGPLPPQPWLNDSPIEAAAQNAEPNTENAQSAKDWGNPGKQHNTHNWYDN